MRELSEILKSNAFRFNKAFGQNFITDGNLLASICEDGGITADDVVVEIGAGGGTLTRCLAERAKKVIAFEIDANLKSVLQETLAGLTNVELVMRDAMKIPTNEINRMAGERYKVAANLPYYITTPLIMKFIEEEGNVSSMTVMVQKEVADRLTARENTPDYGSVTVAVQAAADCRVTRTVGRQMFRPIPNVDSAVVRMDFCDKYQIEDRKLFRSVVKAAFAMRRKTLENNLVASFGFSRDDTKRIFALAGIPQGVRGETLSVADFVRLYETVRAEK